jgi:hypothetical protein
VSIFLPLMAYPPLIKRVRWNPSDKATDIVLTNGNYTAACTSTGCVRATVSRGTSGKYYFEVRVDTVSSHFPMIGVMTGASSLSQQGPGVTFTGGWSWQADNNNTWDNTVAASTTSTNFTTGDVIQVAIDFTAGKIWWGKNNAFINSGNPAAGTNARYSDISGTLYPAVGFNAPAALCTGRFALSQFTYSPPSGFSSWE